LSVPLYQSGAEYANVRASKQIANQYRILLEKTRRAVKADTTSAWESYNAKKAQIVSIQDQIKEIFLACSVGDLINVKINLQQRSAALR